MTRAIMSLSPIMEEYLMKNIWAFWSVTSAVTICIMTLLLLRRKTWVSINPIQSLPDLKLERSDNSLREVTVQRTASTAASARPVALIRASAQGTLIIVCFPDHSHIGAEDQPANIAYAFTRNCYGYAGYGLFY